jgi:hypothetical protein
MKVVKAAEIFHHIKEADYSCANVISYLKILVFWYEMKCSRFDTSTCFNNFFGIQGTLKLAIQQHITKGLTQH